MHHFKLILISDEQFSEKEIPFIKWAFENGLDRFHLRKRLASQEEINALLNAFDKDDLQKITVHYQHDLPSTLLLNIGLHYSLNYLQNSLTRAEILEMKKDSKNMSFSIHQINELDHLPKSFDYAFISPLFPSISKPGYYNTALSADLKTVSTLNKTKLIGLGGILPNHLKSIAQIGLNGAAILGSIWQSKDCYKAMELFFEARNELK